MAVGGETVAAGGWKGPMELKSKRRPDDRSSRKTTKIRGETWMRADIPQLDVNKESGECESVCVFIKAAVPAHSSPALTSTLTDLSHSYNKKGLNSMFKHPLQACGEAHFYHFCTFN